MTLHVYMLQRGKAQDYVIAESAGDAEEVWIDHFCGETPSGYGSWSQLPDEQLLVVGTARMTCGKWVEESGRDFICTVRELEQ